MPTKDYDYNEDQLKKLGYNKEVKPVRKSRKSKSAVSTIARRKIGLKGRNKLNAAKVKLKDAKTTAVAKTAPARLKATSFANRNALPLMIGGYAAAMGGLAYVDAKNTEKKRKERREKRLNASRNL
jgi:hypothetical protein